MAETRQQDHRRSHVGARFTRAHFAISAQVVKRRLAIANLNPDIRRLYRAGDIGAKALHLLTLATRWRQKAWFTLNCDSQQTPMPPWQ